MITPADEAELAEVISSAVDPLAIQGGGTQDVPAKGAPLSTKAMSGITLYEPGALTLVAKAGTPMSEIEAALDAENQMLAFEPMDHRPLLGTTGEPTIGGVVASNISGPRRTLAGACRDFLLGVRFVDGAGNIVKNGGRVMKNVTGYDLARLMCGARGTLGVLTEVSLKVLPKPETEATLTLEGTMAEKSVPAMSAALGTPFEVSGAFFGPYIDQTQDQVHLRVEGSEASVNYRIEQLRQALSDFAPDMTVQDAAASAKLWRDIRDVTFLKDEALVLRVAAQASTVPGIMADRLLGTSDHLDMGGSRIWVSASQAQLDRISQSFDDERKGDPDEAALLKISLVRGKMSEEGGHATLVKASQSVKSQARWVDRETSVLQKMAEGMRAKFDPKGILNPGLMG